MAEFWVRTQEVLQGPDPLVRRPLLTATLLKRPPFRFLQDVISEVILTTGFKTGLPQDQQNNSATSLDRDAKVQYLKTVFQSVGAVTGKAVKAAPVKVVAGLEPEHTNTFLQLLAEAGRLSQQAARQPQTSNRQSTASASVESSAPKPRRSLEASQRRARSSRDGQPASAQSKQPPAPEQIIAKNPERADAQTSHSDIPAVAPGKPPGAKDGSEEAASVASAAVSEPVVLVSRQGPPRIAATASGSQPAQSKSNTGGAQPQNAKVIPTPQEKTGAKGGEHAAMDLTSILMQICEVAPRVAKRMAKCEASLTAAQKQQEHQTVQDQALHGGTQQPS
ncbi:hypothetical protein WJX73_003902 [Symbiochloris irregularis]|uniref:TRAF3-interacting protein 1 N-terminal domain-containing protein n=1 Tax=Symbiochloris irregularis TaxID=706552 RepID=A0AAW1NSI7_9CHLO